MLLAMYENNPEKFESLKPNLEILKEFVLANSDKFLVHNFFAMWVFDERLAWILPDANDIRYWYQVDKTTLTLKNKMRFAKLVRKLVPEISEDTLTQLSMTIADFWELQHATYELKLLSADYVYRHETAPVETCMTGRDTAVKFYSELSAENIAQAAVLFRDGTAVARALVWLGKYYDRIYAVNAVVHQKMLQALKNLGLEYVRTKEKLTITLPKHLLYLAEDIYFDNFFFTGTKLVVPQDCTMEAA